jgi:co-chaperonin GroES (HSP10)
MSYNIVKISKLTPLHNYVIVSDMNFEQRITSGGIIIAVDDKRTEGIRPRWGRVYSVGPEQKEIQVGQWICVAHGRWTRGIEIEDSQGVKVVRRVDINDILLISDEPVIDDTLGNSI